MANKLIVTPILNAQVANLLASADYKAIDRTDVVPMLISQPKQRICVVMCPRKVETGPKLEVYDWVLYLQNEASLNHIMDAGLRDSHHDVALKRLI